MDNFELLKDKETRMFSVFINGELRFEHLTNDEVREIVLDFIETENE